jgi:phosphoglycolate phosphatase
MSQSEMCQSEMCQSEMQSSKTAPAQTSAAGDYRLVVFDVDGTLADTFAWLSQALNAIAPRYRLRPIAPEESDRLRELPGRTVLRHLGVTWWKLPPVARALRRRMTEDLDSIRLFPGVGAMLRDLTDAGLVLGIVSSNSQLNVRRILGPENLSMIGYLECGAAIDGKRAHLRRILKAARLAPRAAIYIGDEIRDIEAARGLGMATGAVLWGYNSAQTLRAHAPERVFASMEEIARQLRPPGPDE